LPEVSYRTTTTAEGRSSGSSSTPHKNFEFCAGQILRQVLIPIIMLLGYESILTFELGKTWGEAADCWIYADQDRGEAFIRIRHKYWTPGTLNFFWILLEARAKENRIPIE